MPHISDLNYHEGATLSLSLPVCVYSHVLYFFPPNKYFTCCTTFRPFVAIYFYKADMPGPCHQPLALAVQGLGFSALTATAWLQSLVGELRSKPLPAEATQDHLDLQLPELQENKFLLFKLLTLLYFFMVALVNEYSDLLIYNRGNPLHKLEFSKLTKGLVYRFILFLSYFA